MKITLDTYGHYAPEGLFDVPQEPKSVEQPSASADPVPVAPTPNGGLYDNAMNFFKALKVCRDATDTDLAGMANAVYQLLTSPDLQSHPAVSHIRSMDPVTRFGLVCSMVLEIASRCMVMIFTNATIFEHANGIDHDSFVQEIRRVFEIPLDVHINCKANTQTKQIFVRFNGQITLVDHMRLRLATNAIEITVNNPDMTVIVKSSLQLQSAYGLFSHNMQQIADCLSNRIL